MPANGEIKIVEQAFFKRKRINPLEVSAIMLVDLFNRTFAFWRGWIPVKGRINLKIEDKEQPALEPSQIRIRIIPGDWPDDNHIYASFNRHWRRAIWEPDSGTIIAPHIVLEDNAPMGNVVFKVVNGRLEFYTDDESGRFLARHARLSNNRHVAANSEHR